MCYKRLCFSVLFPLFSIQRALQLGVLLLPRDGAKLLVLAVAEDLEGLDDGGQDAEGDDEEGELETDGGVVDVLVRGIGNVILEASDRALSPNGVLGAEPQEGEHGEPSVLELLELGLLRLHLERIEGRLAKKGALPGLGEVGESAGLGEEDADDRGHGPPSVHELGLP